MEGLRKGDNVIHMGTGKTLYEKYETDKEGTVLQLLEGFERSPSIDE